MKLKQEGFHNHPNQFRKTTGPAIEAIVAEAVQLNWLF